MTVFTAADAAPLLGVAGPSWWQTAGGLLAVFGLLFACLKLLARWNRRGGPGQAAVLAVWPLGPKREIQVLRLADDVHYVYRHDGAMVLLRQETFGDWERSRAAEARRAGDGGPAAPRGLKDLLRAAALPGRPAAGRAPGGDLSAP